MVVVCPGGPLCAWWAFLGPLVGRSPRGRGPLLVRFFLFIRAELIRGDGGPLGVLPGVLGRGRSRSASGLILSGAFWQAGPRGRAGGFFLSSAAELGRASGLILAGPAARAGSLLAWGRPGASGPAIRWRGAARPGGGRWGRVCRGGRGALYSPGEFSGAYLYSPADFPGATFTFFNFFRGHILPGEFPYFLAFSQYFSVFRVFSAIFSKIISDFVLFRFALIWRGLAAWARARLELSGIAG